MIKSFRFRSVFNTRDQSNRSKQREYGRAAVAEEGEGEADNGSEASAHADVLEGLEQKSACNAETYKGTHKVFTGEANVCAADNNSHKKDKDDYAAEHTKLFADDGENEVRVLCGVGAGVLRLGAFAKTCAPELAGGKSQFTLVCLPKITVSSGVNGGIIGSKNTCFLVIFQEVFPSKGYKGCESCNTEDEPIKLKSCEIKHNCEDEEENKCASKVAGNHNDKTEENTEMDSNLSHGNNMVEVFVFLKEAYMLGHQNNINNFNNFRRLNSYTHKADPAFVTGTVVSAEGDKSQKQNYAYYEQNGPFIGYNVKVKHGKQYEEQYADDYTENLNKQKFERAAFIGLGCASYGDKAINGAYHAKRKKHHVGALHKVYCMRFDFS